MTPRSRRAIAWVLLAALVLPPSAWAAPDYATLRVTQPEARTQRTGLEELLAPAIRVKALLRTRGNTVPVLTPLMEQDGHRVVDRAGAQHYFRYLHNTMKVGAVLLVGNTGEGDALGPDLRAQAIDVLTEEAHQIEGWVVFTHVTGADAIETLRNAKLAAAAGADALVLAPTAFLGKDDEIEPFLRTLRQAHPARPILLYNNHTLGRPLAPALVGRLWAEKLVAGLKDSSGSMEQFRSYLATGIPMSQGDETHLDEAITAGEAREVVVRAVGSSGNFWAVVNEAAAMSDPAARRTAQRLINETLPTITAGGNVPAAAKYLLSKIVVDGAPFMSPLVMAPNTPTLTADQRADLDQLTLPVLTAGMEEVVDERVLVGSSGQRLPVRVFATPEQIGAAQADHVMRLWHAAVQANRPFVMGVATGKTPEPLLASIVERLTAMRPQNRQQYVDALYLVAMDDIVDPETGKNVDRSNEFSAYHYFAQRLFSRIPEISAAVGWADAHLIIPEVGKVSEQVARVKALGGVRFQFMATDAQEGHVAEVAPGEALGDPAVRARENEARDFTALFLDHNPWARGYRGITLTLDHFVEMLAPEGVISFAAFGAGKAAILNRFAKLGAYDPQLPISFLWSPPVASRTTVLLDQAAAASLQSRLRPAAGLEELIKYVKPNRVVVVGPSVMNIPTTGARMEALLRRLQTQGLQGQVIILPNGSPKDPEIDLQLRGLAAIIAARGSETVVTTYVNQTASVRDRVMARLTNLLKKKGITVYHKDSDRLTMILQEIFWNLGIPKNIATPDAIARFFGAIEAAA